MARRGAFLLTAALLVAEVYLALLPYRSPSPHHPAPRLRRVAGLPPLPPLQLSRSLPEHGTLTAPCDRNSEYVNERLAWLWGQAQEGQDWASQCCLCLPCTGPSSANTCTSQFGQDLFLFRNFFRCLPETGLYVDVGAHHPKQLSNSYMLDVCLGWGGGGGVEASDEYSALIVGSRSCRVVHAAAASRDGGELYLGSAGARSETRSSGGGQRVRAATLATLLREANVTIGDGRTGEMVIIDLLAIDVEGDELEALIGLPWDSVWARIIMVENVRASQDVFEFLMDKGAFIAPLPPTSPFPSPPRSRPSARKLPSSSPSSSPPRLC